jgi:hypothetical protein
MPALIGIQRSCDATDRHSPRQVGLPICCPSDHWAPSRGCSTSGKIAERLATEPQHAAGWTKRTLEHWLAAALPACDASVAYEMLSFFGDDVRLLSDSSMW